MMQPDAGRSFLTLRDFDTAAYLNLSCADFRSLIEQVDDGLIHDYEGTAKKKKTEMSFHERSEESFYYKVRKAWETARRPEFRALDKNRMNLKQYCPDCG